MIKMSHNITNNKQALRVLASEGGWFHKKWTAHGNKKETSSCDIENIENCCQVMDIENRMQNKNGNFNPAGKRGIILYNSIVYI